MYFITIFTTIVTQRTQHWKGFWAKTTQPSGTSNSSNVAKSQRTFRLTWRTKYFCCWKSMSLKKFSCRVSTSTKLKSMSTKKLWNPSPCWWVRERTRRYGWRTGGRSAMLYWSIKKDGCCQKELSRTSSWRFWTDRVGN